MASEDWLPQFKEALGEWNKRFIVTSPDVDGLLSAALLCNEFGAKLIGVYTTSHLVMFDKYTTYIKRIDYIITRTIIIIINITFITVKMCYNSGREST